VGEIQSDTRVRVAGGGQLPGQVRLPALDDADVQPYQDPLLDRIGRMVGEHPLVVAGSMVAGSVLGARTGANALSSVLRGAGGLALGFVGAIAIGSVAQRWLGSGSSTTGDYVDSSPAPLEPATDASEGGPEHLRVMSWNVRELIGMDGEVRTDDSALADIKAEVARDHPDVLMLQEVRSDAWFTNGHDDLQELADALGATSAVLVGNGTRPNGSQKGQAILTFGETRLQDARGLHHLDPSGHGLVHDLKGAIGWAHASGWPLPDTGVNFHPRTTTDAMITTPDGTAVRVLDVHLSGTGGPATGGTPGSTEAQQDQLVPVAATIPAWEGPTLLAGDFNVVGGTEFSRFEADVLGKVGLHEAFGQVGTTPGAPETRSYPANEPHRNIDRLYTSSDVRVTTARVADDEHAAHGSDHRPLVADLEITR
jgi:endonuclease/exonuclease/phosphatase family metal-dependent hydrolase